MLAPGFPLPIGFGHPLTQVTAGSNNPHPGLTRFPMTDPNPELQRRLAELEAELQALRAFATAPYRAIVEDMSELVVRWRPDGTRLFVNDAYCRLFGMPREQILGTTFWPLISEKDQEIVRGRIAALSPASPVSTGRHRAHGPDGRLIWMEWVDRALFDAAGNVTELQSVGRDITDRVALEELARRVENADATARVSASIGHDLNNLLTVVLSGLGEVEDDFGRGESLQTVHEAVDKIVALVRQMMRLRFRQPFQPKELDINEQVRRMHALLAEVVGEHVVLTERLCDEACVMLGDATQIDQVLLNLAKNAAEAMPAGGHIVITTRVEAAEPRPLAVITVADTGSGIAPALLPFVFDCNVTTKPNGQGIGLATVKTIVESHGGRIDVRSSPEGTTFDLRFPLSTSLAAAGADPKT